MKPVYLYAKERFPIGIALFFSFILLSTASAYLFSKIRLNADYFISILLLALFLFRVRIGDDIKDAAYDSKFHNDRAVQRGLISVKMLKKTLLAVLATELALQFFLFPGAMPLYLFLVFYWFLMFKDFFSKRLPLKKFFIYILLHQIIFAFYVYYFFCILSRKIIFTRWNDFAAIFFIFICMFIYEVSRKMNNRYDTDGNITNDTYAYKWGKKNVLALLALFFVLQIASLLFIFRVINPFLWAYIGLISAGFMWFRGKNGSAYFIFLIIFGLITFTSYCLK